MQISSWNDSTKQALKHLELLFKRWLPNSLFCGCNITHFFFFFCSGSGWPGSEIASWWGPEAVLIFVKCIWHACMTCMTNTIQACKMHRLGRVVKICRLPGIPYDTFYNLCFQSKVQVVRTAHAKTRGRRIVILFAFHLCARGVKF